MSSVFRDICIGLAIIGLLLLINLLSGCEGDGECTLGDMRCDGDIVQLCVGIGKNRWDDTGHWEDQAVCEAVDWGVDGGHNYSERICCEVDDEVLSARCLHPETCFEERNEE